MPAIDLPIATSTAVGFLLLFVAFGLALAVVLGIGRGWFHLFWGSVVAVSVIPATLALGIGSQVGPCKVSSCITQAEADRLMIAAPALPLLVVGLLLVRRHTFLGCGLILAGQATTAVAIARTNAAGTALLAILAVAEVAYLSRFDRVPSSTSASSA